MKLSELEAERGMGEDMDEVREERKTYEEDGTVGELGGREGKRMEGDGSEVEGLEGEFNLGK